MEGVPFAAAGAGLSTIAALMGWHVVFFLLGALTVFVTAFFRDPDRSADVSDNAVLSPADGLVLKVERLDKNDNPLRAPALKISIFMSVFNVHVNRIPVSGTVTGASYAPGKFLSANLDKASAENERNSILLDTPNGQRIVVIQVAGLIARRIACWVKPGDTVSAGQRFGLIRFGSRLEVYLPVGSQVAVGAGRKVRAGESVLGYLS